jgi:hypothetical protein
LEFTVYKASGEFYLFAPPYIWDSIIEINRSETLNRRALLKNYAKCIFDQKLDNWSLKSNYGQNKKVGSNF